jgi:hypothetical protein
MEEGENQRSEIGHQRKNLEANVQRSTPNVQRPIEEDRSEIFSGKAVLASMG